MKHMLSKMLGGIVKLICALAIWSIIVGFCMAWYNFVFYQSKGARNIARWLADTANWIMTRLFDIFPMDRIEDVWTGKTGVYYIAELQTRRVTEGALGTEYFKTLTIPVAVILILLGMVWLGWVLFSTLWSKVFGGSSSSSSSTPAPSGSPGSGSGSGSWSRAWALVALIPLVLITAGLFAANVIPGSHALKDAFNRHESTEHSDTWLIAQQAFMSDWTVESLCNFNEDTLPSNWMQDEDMTSIVFDCGARGLGQAQQDITQGLASNPAELSDLFGLISGMQAKAPSGELAGFESASDQANLQGLNDGIVAFNAVNAQQSSLFAANGMIGLYLATLNGNNSLEARESLLPALSSQMNALYATNLPAQVLAADNILAITTCNDHPNRIKMDSTKRAQQVKDVATGKSTVMPADDLQVSGITLICGPGGKGALGSGISTFATFVTYTFVVGIILAVLWYVVDSATSIGWYPQTRKGFRFYLPMAASMLFVGLFMIVL